MAIRIAETVPDTTIDTITLSSQQLALAEERIKDAGLDDRIRVHLLDYRDIPPEFEHVFDAFVSIEMIEHVGPKVRLNLINRSALIEANERSTTTPIFD